MKFILLMLIFSLLFLPIVLADIVEITIEYGNETCTESWSCSDWSSCVNSIQTRSCEDLNNCGTTFDKPSESRSCTTAPPAGPGGGGGASSGSGIYTENTTTSTEPEIENPPEQPELKESPLVKIKIFTPDQLEAGEFFNAIVSITSPASEISTTVELLKEKQDVSLEPGETKNISFGVYAPEKEGEYNLVAVTQYATGNKTINLVYSPLFLYIRKIANRTYEMQIKNFDNTSTTEIQIIKDNSQTVYLDILDGKIDYKVNLTFSNPGEYVARAKSVTGFTILDEDTVSFKVGEDVEFNYSMIFLITAVVIILIVSVIIFRR
jgi:hypothetical protein